MNTISLGIGLVGCCGAKTPAPAIIGRLKPILRYSLLAKHSRVGCAIEHLSTVTLRGYFDKSHRDFGVLLHTLRDHIFMGIRLQSNETRSVSCGTEVPTPFIIALPNNAYQNSSLLTPHSSLAPKERPHA